MDENVSKSQKKREAHALQEAGVKLLTLPRDIFDALPISTALRDALEEARRLKSHGAIRRQSQRIGKLMRLEDTTLIMEALARMEEENDAKSASFHAVERWRERLLNEGRTALTEYIDTYPEVDVQQLRQLIARVESAKTPELKSGASRALFRYLRTFIV